MKMALSSKDGSLGLTFRHLECIWLGLSEQDEFKMLLDGEDFEPQPIYTAKESLPFYKKHQGKIEAMSKSTWWFRVRNSGDPFVYEMYLYQGMRPHLWWKGISEAIFKDYTELEQYNRHTHKENHPEYGLLLKHGFIDEEEHARLVADLQQEYKGAVKHSPIWDLSKP